MPPGRLPGEVFRACPSGRRPPGRPRTCWRDFVSRLVWEHFKECFSLYDRQRNGKIKARELITVMRCLGSSPTPSEVQRHLLSHQIEWSGELDFSTLLSIMHQQLRQEAPEEEILEAMRMADKEQKGFILVSELRAKLTSLGEKLTDGEVDELLKAAGVGADGWVHCEHFPPVFS
uniref:Calmodulin like 4 n=1 Tax=Takifugu rubripes TaxID=31033 RepID=H2RYE3_TAKRU